MNPDHPMRVEITEAFRVYILANNAFRKSPCGWKSVRGPEDSPEWKEYAVLSEAFQKASSDLWMVTDVEYEEDGFRDRVWNWRFWKVMARKCCWYQRFGTKFKAGWTMGQLAKAELRFVEACGLLSIYKSSRDHIEEAFPNLKCE